MAESNAATTATMVVSADGWFDGVIYKDARDNEVEYPVRPWNYEELEAARTGAIEATNELKSAAASANAAAAAGNSAAQSANAAATKANESSAKADVATAEAKAAAANAKPYYFQATEPTRDQRVDGMLWLHTNESEKTAVAKRWDAGLPGKAVFPGASTMPGASTVIDEIGAWTQFAL